MGLESTPRTQTTQRGIGSGPPKAEAPPSAVASSSARRPEELTRTPAHPRATAAARAATASDLTDESKHSQGCALASHRRLTFTLAAIRETCRLYIERSSAGMHAGGYVHPQVAAISYRNPLRIAHIGQSRGLHLSSMQARPAVAD